MFRARLMMQTQFRSFACDPSTATGATIQQMKEKLSKEFEPIHVDVIDHMGDASSVQINVISDKFEGMMPLARHRAINSLLKDEIKMIHAVSIDAKTPK